MSDDIRPADRFLPTGTSTAPAARVAEDRPVDTTAGRRAAVLGRPIAHSLSPALHLAAYRELGLDWRYDRVECAEDQLGGFLGSAGPEWAGLSLTMPLKRVAMQLADEVSDLAAAVGAANTLVFTEGRRRVENTDVGGIVGALREAGVTSPGRALILGAGGTAQSALAALRELGQTSATVMVRDLGRTGELRATAARLGVRPNIVGGLDRAGLHQAALPDADLVISTLPGAAADPLRLGDAHVVLDVVYAPWPTALAASAAARGAQIVSGLSVLLHQAVAQVELMTGLAAPVEAMREALAAAVAARAG